MSINDAAHVRHSALAAGAHAFIPKDRIFVELGPAIDDAERRREALR